MLIAEPGAVGRSSSREGADQSHLFPLFFGSLGAGQALLHFPGKEWNVWKPKMECGAGIEEGHGKILGFSSIKVLYTQRTSESLNALLALRATLLALKICWFWETPFWGFCGQFPKGDKYLKNIKLLIPLTSSVFFFPNALRRCLEEKCFVLLNRVVISLCHIQEYPTFLYSSAHKVLLESVQ